MAQIELPNRSVLFLDILGFARLTEEHALDVETIQRRQHILTTFETIFQEPNPLTETFVNFHEALKWAIEIAQMRRPITAITFSDSAFIVTSSISDCIAVATDLVRSLLTRGVPCRAGIAWGTFSAVRFKSDVMGEWGDHSAHFLGTGIVRANAAERCGIKGIRILVHPSAEALITSDEVFDDGKARLMACSAEEAVNEVGVKYEIDYWEFNPTAERAAWHALQDLWTKAPRDAHDHYEATACAVNQMRVRRGEEPMENLRGRTLPRKLRSS
jgi:hypothetical protein